MYVYLYRVSGEELHFGYSNGTQTQTKYWKTGQIVARNSGEGTIEILYENR